LLRIPGRVYRIDSVSLSRAAALADKIVASHWMGLKLAHDIVVSVIVFVFQYVDCDIRYEKKVGFISTQNAAPSWL
jgi:hypothetical protein